MTFSFAWFKKATAMNKTLLIIRREFLSRVRKNKKKDAGVSDDKFMRAARFGRVKNDLKMGFVG